MEPDVARDDGAPAAFRSSKKSHENGFAHADMYKEKVRDDAEEEHDTRCGYWACRPDTLQKCNNPKSLLMFLCCFAMAQGKVEFV